MIIKVTVHEHWHITYNGNTFIIDEYVFGGHTVSVVSAIGGGLWYESR